MRNKILDIYFRTPIFFDILFSILYLMISRKYTLFHFVYINSTDVSSLTSNLIGTSISLAGFLIASLTIIVTIKSNLLSKKLEESSSALELLFNSSNYKQIVSVFKKSIIELIIIVAVLYSIWTLNQNISHWLYNQILLCAISITVVSICRSLIILFKVLSLEHFVKD